MASKILKLSEEVINKIAAGEVIENPASIVKELIENSLDAKASHIQVVIEGGGVHLIRVEDDGFGMSGSDARASIERYATSKIRSAEDLENLQTMGFRGEALAAIAAVSRLDLKTNDGNGGTWMQVEAGRIVSSQPCARNRGTTLEIRSLFFNTPVRQKFLKSPAANTALIHRIVETFALAHPEISFFLSCQGDVVLETEPEMRKQRIEKILGGLPIELSSKSIWGLLSLPEMAKSHRREQFLFINRRPIFSPLIARAIKMGYGTRLAQNAHPCFVLFFDVAPEEVDVNVHPQKKEVRFSDEQRVFKLFEKSVRKAFGEEMESFASPLSFSNSSFSLQETPPAFLTQNLKAEPLDFSFSIAEYPLAVIDHFLLLQKEGFFLIDLQAAHARVLFETFREKKRGAQMLLHPIEISIEKEEILDELLELGIEARILGKKTAVIDALPTGLEPAYFDSFLSCLQKGKKINDTAVRYCRSLKKKYSLDEALSLWKSLQTCKESRLDPDLKPIWIQIEKHHLQSLFG